jgi:hypothetical protein
MVSLFSDLLYTVDCAIVPIIATSLEGSTLFNTMTDRRMGSFLGIELPPNTVRFFDVKKRSSPRPKEGLADGRVCHRKYVYRSADVVRPKMKSVTENNTMNMNGQV